jgi:hypothetical protein
MSRKVLLFGFDHDLDGATRRDRTGHLLITKYDQWLQGLHGLHPDVLVINNLGKLLSLKEQLPRAELDGVLTQF